MGVLFFSLLTYLRMKGKYLYFLIELKNTLKDIGEFPLEDNVKKIVPEVTFLN